MTADPTRPTERTDRSDLTGQCALVTGSTRGIGRGIALLLAAHGAHVVVHRRSPNAVQEVRREVEALGGAAMGVPADLTDDQDVQRMHDEVVGAWGTPDIVVANAGGSPDARAPATYAAGKAGIELLTQDLAAQAGPFGVRVNCVAPETILTERNQRMIPPDVQAQLVAPHPARRLGTDDDVAQADS